MPATPTMPRLYDHIQEREIVLDYPGVSNEDVLAFCAYFKVSFHSMKALTSPPPGMSVNDMFRVSTLDYPSRGLDVSFRSVASWKKADKVRYSCPQPGDVVELRNMGRVQVHCVAEALHAEDGDIVAFEQADGRIRYIARERFVGVSYDRESDSYLPNAVKVEVPA